MSLADLFEKVEIVQNTRKANAKRKKSTVVVNAEEHPEYIIDQIRSFVTGTPQRVTRSGNFIIAHSVFSI